MGEDAPASGSEPRAVPPRGLALPPRDDAAVPPLDNYAEFIGRLDAAAGNLAPRLDALSKALGAAELLVDQNRAGSELWGQRLSRVSQLLARQSANRQAPPSGTLSDLHDVAVKMERLFSSRTQRVQDVCTAIRARRDQINTSLFELEKSKVKLSSSRMLAQEREKLTRLAADLSMGAESIGPGFPDTGLQATLREAREAILLAEALLEVKGN
ncbi:hypothetical protein [Arthrobacter sp. PM3]|uniref:hypothetical protein n=1 Tax=Arthrobacter sp. PM3 TaxID=2017685 RepID=UPI000E10DDF5|nr:hypothetical protein [Arthrobacter sp. PM3]AXJ10245.1 hypothetical protein CFN17_11925 [Arthrobacter sp. PM3]